MAKLNAIGNIAAACGAACNGALAMYEWKAQQAPHGVAILQANVRKREWRPAITFSSIRRSRATSVSRTRRRISGSVSCTNYARQLASNEATGTPAVDWVR